jgi:hypothetical protein
MRENVQMIDWSGHLFRCSGLSNITSTGRGAEITSKQKSELAGLLSKIKCTEIQALRRNELQEKMDAKPELSKGAKTYLEGLWVEVTFNRRKDFSSKFTSKGNEQETESMHLANRVLGWGLETDYIEGVEFIKQRENNDLITGEPDLNAGAYGSGLLADIKSSWNVHTFPHFKDDIDPAYYGQGQGYMWLCGKSKYELVYCLVDTPERLILDEIRRTEWAEGFIEIPDEHEDAIRQSMTFEDIPEEARVKRYTFERDDEYIKKIEECVKMSRAYLLDLNTKFLNHNN